MHAQFVREVVMNSSTQMVFFTFGSMDVVATTTFRWLAIGLSDCCYNDQHFSSEMPWVK